MNVPKQVIVLRKDLNMRKGKMVAQGAHASMAVILNMMKRSYNEETTEVQYTMKHFENSDLHQWLDGKFTKICVSVDSEAELIELFQKAELADLPCAMITDSGATEFGGVPTKTAVAIGPANPTKIDVITGHLKLL